MFNLSLEQIVIAFLAIAVFGKPAVALLSKIPIFIPFIPFLEKLAGNGNGKNNGEPEWAKNLRAHYNEEITQKLSEINNTLVEIKEENLTHHKFEEGKFELLEALIKK